MLAALNRQTEFKHHFKGALNNGLSLEDLREVLFQIACYCGIPAGIEAFRSAREVLKAEGIDTTGLDPR
jgi:4-carboxymuconolactone decarboxylase